MKSVLVLVVSLFVVSSSVAVAEEMAATQPEATVSSPGRLVPSEASRVRFGANGQLGWFFPQPMFTFGAEARVGWSFNRLLAAYVSLGAGSGLYFGGSAGSNGGSASITAMSQWYVGAMAEANLGDLFFVGLGPAIGKFSLAGMSISASTTGGNEAIQAMGGWTPSVDLKFGFGFGKRNPETGRRTGFTLAVDLRAVFPTDSVYVTNGTSGQSVEVHRAAFGLAPMLMLGFDSR